MNEIYQMQTEAQSVTQSVQNSAPKPDFDSLSLEALLAMKADLEQAIVKKQEERLEQIKREVMQLAERSGVSYADLLEQLTARSGKRQKGGGDGRKIPYRYRHPTDPEKGWTGRGLPPRWLKEWEASGRSREELRINQGERK
ncbi:DNA-binding protein [Hydrogenophilus thermoluteolus]|uniref:H-NS histone family protein n=1 Tax=Hydrogenophilus thermoluteolus TaxID=297 RepID=UPI0024A134E3|nr:H-NS histone family protein [Hydrogenophilus thermoluteolus]GLW61546.1 DNA-binding protein [Hydrogenophilus thermoluteolus]